MRLALAAPHTAALDAAAQVVRQGGTVVDAAVAGAASLAVVAPHLNSAGGDVIALIRSPDGVTTCLNASGAYGSGGTAKRLLDEGGTMPTYGPATVSVPGAVSGWQALLDTGGSLPLGDVLAPAIRQATEGVPISPGLGSSLQRSAERLFADPGFRSVFAPDGQPLRTGEVLRQPALAATLEELASNGLNTLYAGRLAQRLAAGLHRLGVPVTAADLAAHRVEVCEPLVGAHRGARVLTAPPNSQGYLLLAILAALDLDEESEPDAALLAEVFAGADALRDAELADPRSMTVSPGSLVSRVRAQGLLDKARERLASGRAQLRSGPVPDGDTVALTAVGDDGTAVSLIQSNFHGFGAGLLEPDTGLSMHNRGCFFSLTTGHPNILAPGRRPAHTLMPVLVEHADGSIAAHGTMGGRQQPQIHTHLMQSTLQGATPQQAVSAPRFVVGSRDSSSVTDRVLAEPEVDARVIEQLGRCSLPVQVAGDRNTVGHAMISRLCADGSLEAGADPRADGGVLLS
ncbi:MAG: gamma-glutamyltransferase [Actinomycetota bacterium]|nr:gamma-glutamyltransferase [Actinomycetota bacterium]